MALIAVILGPHRAFKVCSAERCAAMASEEACACCGAAEDEASAPAAPGAQTARSVSCCCIDLSLPLEPAPVPRVPEPPEPPEPTMQPTVDAFAPIEPPQAEPRPVAAPPPRPDRRTRLLATTILRL